jgi:hypothetical protein
MGLTEIKKKDYSATVFRYGQLLQRLVLINAPFYWPNKKNQTYAYITFIKKSDVYTAQIFNFWICCSVICDFLLASDNTWELIEIKSTCPIFLKTSDNAIMNFVPNFMFTLYITYNQQGTMADKKFRPQLSFNSRTL